MVRPRALAEDGDKLLGGEPDALVVHDDVLGLLGQTLGFIPSWNPSRRCEPQHGLNLHGCTLLRGEGAAVAARVFHAWADLYAAAPPRFSLVGESFSTPEPDDEPDNGSYPYDIGVGVGRWIFTDDQGNGYIRRDIDRDALVAVLRRLAEWSARVAADEGLCILHLGY